MSLSEVMKQIALIGFHQAITLKYQTRLRVLP